MSLRNERRIAFPTKGTSRNIDVNDGAGPFCATVQEVEYGYSRLDGSEHVFVVLRDFAGDHCRLTLEELNAATLKAGL